MTRWVPRRGSKQSVTLEESKEEVGTVRPGHTPMGRRLSAMVPRFWSKASGPVPGKAVAVVEDRKDQLVQKRTLSPSASRPLVTTYASTWELPEEVAWNTATTANSGAAAALNPPSTTRQSTEDTVKFCRAALAEFTNRPFTLREKITRWCSDIVFESLPANPILPPQSRIDIGEHPWATTHARRTAV